MAFEKMSNVKKLQYLRKKRRDFFIQQFRYDYVTGCSKQYCSRLMVFDESEERIWRTTNFSMNISLDGTEFHLWRTRGRSWNLSDDSEWKIHRSQPNLPPVPRTSNTQNVARGG